LQRNEWVGKRSSEHGDATIITHNAVSNANANEIPNTSTNVDANVTQPNKHADIAVSDTHPDPTTNSQSNAGAHFATHKHTVVVSYQQRRHRRRQHVCTNRFGLWSR
jgi:hypothetical protein